MYLGNGLWDHKKTKAEKWGIVKKITAAVTLISWGVMIAIGIGTIAYQENAKKDVKALAKENGYVETIDMDEFMKTSDNVSKEEYAKYNKLKEKIEGAKVLTLTQVATLGSVGLASGGVHLIADKKEDEMDFLR